MKPKRKLQCKMWAITIEGEIVDTMVSHTRKGAIDAFMEGESQWTWKDYQRESNYKVERVMVTAAKGHGL